MKQTPPIRVPPYFNFAADVIDRCAEHRNQLALHWVNGNLTEERKFTFFDLSQLSCQVANVLKGHGIKKGDRILVMLPRIPQWWSGIIGMHRRGSIPVPATTQLTSKDIQYRLETAGIRAVITSHEHAAKFRAIRKHVSSVKTYFLVGAKRSGWVEWDREVARASTQYRGSRTKATDPGLVYFTSGTTGNPKMVLHTQASAPLGHKVTGQWLGVTSNDLSWCLTDTGWAKAGWSASYGPWNFGACVFAHDSRGKFDASTTMQVLERFRITTFCAPPTAYRMLVMEDLAHYDLSYLRRCVGAGEALNPAVIRTWKRKTGILIHEGYGQSEGTLVIGNFPGMKVKVGSMGVSAPGFQMAVVDTEGKPLPCGKEGELAVKIKPKRPLGLFVKYWRNPKENRERFVGDYYLTGDRAIRDKDGYYWFVGRTDDVIISSGYRIGPFEVESALVKHPSVVEAAAVAKPDPVRGSIVKAFCILADGYSPSAALAKKIQDHVKKTTAPYKYPREIEFVDTLPTTISGKILRSNLRRKR